MKKPKYIDYVITLARLQQHLELLINDPAIDPPVDMNLPEGLLTSDLLTISHLLHDKIKEGQQLKNPS